MGVVHTSQGGLKPASEHLKSEPWIVSQLAHKVFGEQRDWLSLASNYDSIRDLMSRALYGFENYNQRVREPNGFCLPNPPRDSRTFATPDGKAHFIPHPLPNLNIPEHQYVMITVRSHDQYNTTIYDLHDRYRGTHGNRRIILMNEEDIKARGWQPKDYVDIVSHFGNEERRAEKWQLVAYAIPRGNIATYFPEANVLVPLNSTAEKSNTPTSKWIVCSLHLSKNLNAD